ncbi:nucleotide sugar dehydrogenase [Gammaproteobacteria bacterium]|nr:nucleotide sugar dehydrogenase [Gammaproteobacteria bacterium]
MEKITIIGAGYVGMSLAALLSKKNPVTVFDISIERVEMINSGISTVQDELIEMAMKNQELNLQATNDPQQALIDADIVIIATPTNYDEKKAYFDTSSVQASIKTTVEINKNALIVIKSTIPVGFTKSMNHLFQSNKIIFSPEFLREGKALYDNLNPSRIIIGTDTKIGKKFANMLYDAADIRDVPILYMGSTEAEAVKLFANSYLAMRVAYFNEIDNYALVNQLNSKDIIQGISHDPRIGNFYNNPSFGYGGYCLPKDTQQLLANFDGVPQNLIAAIVESNNTRKNFLSEYIISFIPKIVGVYGLAMKSGSDNFRSAAIIDLINILKKNNINIVIFEPLIKDDTWEGLKNYSDLEAFKLEADLILTNRMDPTLENVKNKVITRDLFNEN